MDKRQKQIAMIAGGALVLYLLYRYVSGGSSSNTSAVGTPAGDTASSDYAALAGQEQGDVSALQQQNSQLLGQEQSDVADLNQQEQSDVGTLTGAIGDVVGSVTDLGTRIGTLTGQTNALGTQVSSLAIGEAKVNRAVQAQTITTKAGGPFAKYYKQVTGKNPPLHVNVSNLIYQGWKSGVKAATLKAKLAPHPSAPKNTLVAHPNGNHTQQTAAQRVAAQKKKAAQQKAAAQKAAAAAKAKAKASGRRK